MVSRAAIPRHPIDAPGTDEAAWSAWPGLRALPAAELAGLAGAVVVAAHPDDEVLGAGGLISMLAAAGTRLDRFLAVPLGSREHHRQHRRRGVGEQPVDPVGQHR